MYSASYLCPILMKLEISRKISEKILLNLIKFRPVGAADGRTDMSKLIVAFRKFAKAP
jgi:hypothetical protein